MDHCYAVCNLSVCQFCADHCYMDLRIHKLSMLVNTVYNDRLAGKVHLYRSAMSDTLPFIVWRYIKGTNVHES